MDPRLEDEEAFTLTDLPYLEFKDEDFLVSYKKPKDGTPERIEASVADYAKGFDTLPRDRSMLELEGKKTGKKTKRFGTILLGVTIFFLMIIAIVIYLYLARENKSSKLVASFQYKECENTGVYEKLKETLIERSMRFIPDEIIEKDDNCYPVTLIGRVELLDSGRKLTCRTLMNSLGEFLQDYGDSIDFSCQF
ncbi:DgyrCDS5624 [Dimorphilus gyrociliatus]|uniref:DgyrCDS5624 n=1 Tax=Dimorphilus gyrociliatus TaxID=2664684 RepID=A0A7I8VMR7_9ANNE|nr:DgyrCDS5624 [Dimorphilus gyrociliatus]